MVFVGMQPEVCCLTIWLIDSLYKDKYLTGVESDVAKEQYEYLIDTGINQNKSYLKI